MFGCRGNRIFLRVGEVFLLCPWVGATNLADAAAAPMSRQPKLVATISVPGLLPDSEAAFRQRQKLRQFRELRLRLPAPVHVKPANELELVDMVMTEQTAIDYLKTAHRRPQEIMPQRLFVRQQLAEHFIAPIALGS